MKRRLELSLEYLSSQADPNQTYSLESGIRITYPGSRAEAFLKHLYTDIFDRRRNVSRVLEALAGRNVRRALDMFISIITSGHMSETAITSTVMGGGSIAITEHGILRILMRTEYRFFSDRSGFVSNIFGSESSWRKPDNFLFSECLFFLAFNRKRIGQIGLEGYFSCQHVANELQRFGYTPEDTLKALNLLLRRELIAADHMNFVSVGFDDSVRILAAGWTHIRLLAGRLEYLYGVIPSTPIFDRSVAKQLSDFVRNENIRGDISPYQKIRAVELFYSYLLRQKKNDATPFWEESNSGASYVLKHIASAIEHFRSSNPTRTIESDPLDL